MSRKTMKRHAALKSVVLGIIVVLLSFSSSESAEDSMVIKMATLAPEGSTWMQRFNTINAEVMEKTQDAVRFKIYPGGVLGDEKDMLRKMQIGQIHGAALTTGGLAVLFEDMNVFHIPFFFQDYREVDYVLEKMGSYFRKGFEDRGYIILGWSEGGFIYLMSTTPISSVSELQKAKVWVWHESPMSTAIFKEAGVAAIPLSVTDVLVGLQTGLVEVVYAPPTGAISLQWFTRIKYLTDVPLSYIGGGLVVRKDIFTKLPQSTRDIVIETFRRHLDQLKAITRKENQEAIQVMEKHGVQIVTPPEDQVAEFKRLSDKAIADLRGEVFSDQVLTDLTSHLEDYRQEHR
jgi:TRAP-type C4-dicarboxylate transport system substrate-binding protein